MRQGIKINIIQSGKCSCETMYRSQLELELDVPQPAGGVWWGVVLHGRCPGGGND